MAEERANVLDRRSGPSTHLRRRVAQLVTPDLAQASGLGVAPQVPVERRVRDREGADALGLNGPASGRARGENRLPSRLRQLAAPDCAPLRAGLVPGRAFAR